MFESLAKNKTVPRILIVTMLYFSALSNVHAVMITGNDLVTVEQNRIDRNKLLQSLDREDVRAALVAQGVDPEMAKHRVMSMTAEEVSFMNQKLDELPAGAGVLELAVFVFLVLLITDILGFTDIFPFVKKTAK